MNVCKDVAKRKEKKNGPMVIGLLPLSNCMFVTLCAHMCTETHGFAQSIFTISKPIRQEGAVRSCTKMKQSLQICCGIQVANYRIWNRNVMQPWKLRVSSWLESSLLIHSGYGVLLIYLFFGVNWLVGTEEGHLELGYSTDSRFLHLRNTTSYLYISSWLHTHATSAWVIKVTFKIVGQYIIVTHYFRGREITKK